MANDVAGTIARKMNRVAVEIQAANRDAVTAAALELKRAIEPERDKAAGGDDRLSNVGTSGARLGLGFDVKGTRNPTALLRARGPWQLVTNRIGPHVITPKRSRARRNLNAAGRIIGGSGRAAGRVGSQLGDLSGLGSGSGGRRAVLIGGSRATPRGFARHPGIPKSRQPQPWRKGLEAGIPKAIDQMRSDIGAAARKGFIR